MNYSLNQHAYYLPYARFRKPYKSLGLEIQAGEELSVHQDIVTVLAHSYEVYVGKLAGLGFNVFPVHLSIVELFVKIVQPLFKVGDIVIRKDDEKNGISAFRIYEYTIVHGKVWYRDGWCVATNCESGVYEEHLRLVDPHNEEAVSWNIDYYDSLVKEKYPTRYNCTVK